MKEFGDRPVNIFNVFNPLNVLFTIVAFRRHREEVEAHEERLVEFASGGSVVNQGETLGGGEFAPVRHGEGEKGGGCFVGGTPVLKADAAGAVCQGRSRHLPQTVGGKSQKDRRN